MDGWIPAPLQPRVLCPLSNDEVVQLYASQGAISPEEEVQLSVQQPALEKLVSPADFRSLVQEKDGASKRSQSHRKDLWDNRPGKEHPSTHLQQLCQRVAATARPIPGANARFGAAQSADPQQQTSCLGLCL